MFRSRTVVVLMALAALPLSQASGQDPYYSAPSYWGYSPVAAIIESEGRYLVAVQQASLLRETVRQEKLKTARQTIEFQVWRRDYEFEVFEKERRAAKEREKRTARDEPPSTEVFSGTTLNILRDELVKVGAGKLSARLDPESLGHVHFGGKVDRGLGILEKKTIFWPPLLMIPQFDESRGRVEKLLTTVKEDLMNSRGINSNALMDIHREVKKMREHVSKGHHDDAGEDVVWTPSNYVGARHELSKIDDAATTLQRQPDAAFYLRKPSAKTLGDLIAYMEDKSVYFTEAMPGDERFYMSLWNTMSAALRQHKPDEPAER